MKSVLHLPINPQCKIIIEPGNEITPKTVLFEENTHRKIEKLDLGQILHIKPGKIIKYLKKKIGQHLDKDEIIAVRKNLFSSTLVKSPFSGIIVEIDAKTGNLIFELDQLSSRKVSSPVFGKVKNIHHDNIEIEVEGEVFEGNAGDGDNISGKLVYYTADKLDIYDFDDRVNNSIVAAKFITQQAVPKMETLGAKGIIVTEIPIETELSWVEVDEQIYKKIKQYENCQVLIVPEMRRIICNAKKYES